jgi:hypothetical protein
MEAVYQALMNGKELKNSDSSETEKEAYHSIEEYKIPGIHLLVKWLNRLANSEDIEKDLQELLQSAYHPNLRKYLIYWIVICSSSGNQLYNMYKNQEEKPKVKIIKFPKKN